MNRTLTSRPKRNGEMMPKLSQEEIAQRKAERKAQHQSNFQQYQEYRDQPIPPMSFSEKIAMFTVALGAIGVLAIFAIVTKGDQVSNFKEQHPFIVIVMLVIMLVALIGTTVYLKRQRK